jgi:limonene 1,2-monooxygenase
MAYGLADFCGTSPTSRRFHRSAGRQDPVEFLTSSGLACIGTPDDCIKHFERLWLGSNGGFCAVLMLSHNWANWEATKRSYELMARYVHPHVQRNANELRQRSYDDAKSKYATAGAQSQAAVQAAIDKHQGRKG